MIYRSLLSSFIGLNFQTKFLPTHDNLWNVKKILTYVSTNRLLISSISCSSNDLNISNNSTSLFNNYDKEYERFIYNRNWNIVKDYWANIIKKSCNDVNYQIPSFLNNKAGMRGEFICKDIRYLDHRNFAIKIGYVGTQYQGYQIQKKTDIRTVEKDLKDILASSLKCGLGRMTVCGRTDKDVSAICQIVNFSPNNKNITANDIIHAVRESIPCKEGKRIFVYDCVRVPKKFNSRSSAMWRKYTYLFPVNRMGSGGEGGIDVDIGRLNIILQKLVNQELSYQSFSFNEDRSSQGSGYNCTLKKANARLIAIQENDDQNNIDNNTDKQLVVAIDLVGNRFLRRMVRLLLSAAIKESRLDILSSNRNDSVLMNMITNYSPRQFALPGEGLCLSGVGFDIKDLSLFKFMPKVLREKIIEEDSIDS